MNTFSPADLMTVGLLAFFAGSTLAFTVALLVRRREQAERPKPAKEPERDENHADWWKNPNRHGDMPH